MAIQPPDPRRILDNHKVTEKNKIPQEQNPTLKDMTPAIPTIQLVGRYANTKEVDYQYQKGRTFQNKPPKNNTNKINPQAIITTSLPANTTKA